MEDEDNIYRLKEVLPDVNLADIISSLTKNENQAFETLRFFMEKDITQVDTVFQQDKCNDDIMCIRHFLPNHPVAHIKEVLDVIGDVPNRVYIAMKIIVFLLDGKQNKTAGVRNETAESDRDGSVTPDLSRSGSVTPELRENGRFTPELDRFDSETNIIDTMAIINSSKESIDKSKCVTSELNRETGSDTSEQPSNESVMSLDLDNNEDTVPISMASDESEPDLNDDVVPVDPNNESIDKSCRDDDSSFDPSPLNKLTLKRNKNNDCDINWFVDACPSTTQEHSSIKKFKQDDNVSALDNPAGKVPNILNIIEDIANDVPKITRDQEEPKATQSKDDSTAWIGSAFSELDRHDDKKANGNSTSTDDDWNVFLNLIQRKNKPSTNAIKTEEKPVVLDSPSCSFNSLKNMTKDETKNWSIWNPPKTKVYLSPPKFNPMAPPVKPAPDNYEAFAAPIQKSTGVVPKKKTLRCPEIDSGIPLATDSSRPIVAPPRFQAPAPSSMHRRASERTAKEMKKSDNQTSLAPSNSTVTSSQPSASTVTSLAPSTSTVASLAPSTSTQVPESNKIPVEQHLDMQLVRKVSEMFPLALPEYIKEVCAGRIFDPQTFNVVVDIILSTDYPTRPERVESPERNVDPEEQLAMLQSLLPDADPSYLKSQIEKFGTNQDELGMFVNQALVNQDYPTKKEHDIKQQLLAQQNYTIEFNVDRFLEIFPDPKSVFEDPKRKMTANMASAVDNAYVNYVIGIIFYDLYAMDLQEQVHKLSTYKSQDNLNIFTIIKNLEEFRKTALKKKIKIDYRYHPLCPNIPLLQECAYFEHKTEILNRLEAKRQQLIQNRANAKELGLFETCGCCYDDEVMPEDIFTCPSGCRFCRECIRRSTEVAFGDGKIDILCFTPDCNKEFSLHVLQSVLTPKLFSKLAQKKALAEVKAAGIEDLETCPFCDFANIPTAEDKIFRCLNPDCMKESCRACKEPAHLPLRCEEVEKDEDIKNRIYIENKMTEALIRQCYKCSAKFIKEEGCNKMTCSCGAVMCYICRQPVLNGYKHFNGQGGDRYDLCPLYTDNFIVNEKNVLDAAEIAKKEVDPKKLKHDPTADLKQHFEKQIKKHKEREGRPPGPEQAAVVHLVERLYDARDQIDLYHERLMHHAHRRLHHHHDDDDRHHRRVAQQQHQHILQQHRQPVAQQQPHHVVQHQQQYVVQQQPQHVAQQQQQHVAQQPPQPVAYHQHHMIHQHVIHHNPRHRN